jgi:hypothetical protein
MENKTLSMTPLKIPLSIAQNATTNYRTKIYVSIFGFVQNAAYFQPHKNGASTGEITNENERYTENG